MDIAKQYNLVGEDYISSSENQGSIKEQKSKEFILNNVDFRNKIVLDLGCGYGRDIRLFEDKGAEVFGIDSSELMVHEAKKVVRNPDSVLIADALKLPFPNNKFDIIIAKHSLHYLEDLDAAIKEVARTLKSGGLLILTVPHPFSEIFLKKSKSYDNKEKIFFKAHQKFILEFPSHKLSDYLSVEFNTLFEIKKIWELTKKEEWIENLEAPVVLGIMAVKK